MAHDPLPPGSQTIKSNSYVTTDDQSDSLSWSQASIRGQKYFITFRKLRVGWYAAPSLMKRRVCSLHLLLSLSSTIIRESEPSRTHDHVSLSAIWYSLNLEGQIPVSTPAQQYVQALGPTSVASYDSQGYGGCIYQPPHGVFTLTATSSSSSYFATDGQSNSPSWWAHDQIFTSLFDCYFLSLSCKTPSLRTGRVSNVNSKSKLLYPLQQGRRSKAEVTLRLTVGQSVCLGIEHLCGTCDQILLPVGIMLS
jgi:hypothetical protein